MARLFGKLYANSRTQGKHNLLFLLTGAGHVNFGGTKHWLGNTDVRLLEKIDFALCLDAIGSGDNLYMHVSKLPKDETGQKLYEVRSVTQPKSSETFTNSYFPRDL